VSDGGDGDGSTYDVMLRREYRDKTGEPWPDVFARSWQATYTCGGITGHSDACDRSTCRRRNGDLAVPPMEAGRG